MQILFNPEIMKYLHIGKITNHLILSVCHSHQSQPTMHSFEKDSSGHAQVFTYILFLIIIVGVLIWKAPNKFWSPEEKPVALPPVMQEGVLREIDLSDEDLRNLIIFQGRNPTPLRRAEIVPVKYGPGNWL
ncbi:MAG: hypothetical protein JWP09_774 [Candidatus Taylorbacteria bacterium]|nr:hypothetical protein [Candidatus Taylorbacteria bacterium]